MSATTGRFAEVLQRMGSNVLIHREDNGSPCPCLTPEGFRDPAWHVAHADDDPPPPMCNEQGFLTTPVEFIVKASIQPPRMRGNHAAQRVDQLLGEIQADDKIGYFPCEWNGNVIDFSDWSDAGEDFIVYDGNRYMVVQFDKLPDIDGNPSHHYECGLRLMKSGRPS